VIEDLPSVSLSRLLARPEAIAVHFDLGLRAYTEGDARGVRRHLAAVGMLPEGGPLCLEFLALGWRERWLEDDPAAALAIAKGAATRFSHDLDTVLELADILLEIGDSRDVLEILLAVSEQEESNPDLWHEAALAAERDGQVAVRSACYRRVWELEHDTEPAYRLWLPEAKFMAIAEETMARLPPTTRANLGNVVVIVEDYTELWVLDGEPGDPRSLGLFVGPERSYEKGLDYVAEGPARIYLYRWNIERMCDSEDIVEEQIAITVLHEIGHYLGLGEDELELRGLG
jgi:predicted Zn-dependent protease with MMP-like domain